MTPARWEQIKGLFHATLEHEAAQRATFLAGACADDVPLRQEVESLLASHEQAASFIETPASDVAAELLADAQPGLVAGQRVGPFTISRVLATGGMGEVYLAEDSRLGRQVALKLLPPQFTVNADRVRRFGLEARAASALNHPNIVTIHEIGQTDSLHFIATEFVDGETLREHMANVQMKLDEVLGIAIQIGSALAAAHAAGIMHRDIKPENVMIRPDGYVKVLDFGLAKLVEQKNTPFLGLKESTQSAAGLILGTVNYMSPEQAKGERVDERTDIFSFGVVLYEMLTGRTPFVGESTSETFANLINAEPQPLSLFVNHVPDQLSLIVSRMLCKNKDERYQTMTDILTDLKDLEIGAPLKRSLPSDAHGGRTTTGSETADITRAPRPTFSAEYLVNKTARKRVGLALAAAAVVLTISAIAYFSYPTSRREAIGSIAVLPFVNVSADPNTEYLSDGISDGIINSLTRLPNLKVNSLTSVLRYKGKPVDVQTVGRDLNVRAVLVGRLTKQGDRLAISAELVDVSDNRRLWGGQYNRKLSEILVVQDEIAREITEGLRLQLTGEEKKQLAKQRTENTEAYLLYSLGNYSSRKMTKEGFEKGIESFEQAIKIDPNYALAYAALAATYHFMGSRGFSPPRESQQKVEWAALKALQLDDTLAEAHVSLGVSKFITFDWVGAEKEIKRALELDPNSPQANEAYSVYLRTVRGGAEGLPYAIRARELEASPDRGEAAFAYYMARQYDKAIELYRKNIEKKPDNAHAHILLGEAYVAKGLPAEGLAMMQKGMALDAATLDKKRWDRYPLLAYAYAAAGRRDEALQILAEQKELAKQGYVSPYNFAVIYTGVGDKDHAFEWLTRCVDERVLIIFHLKSRPLFDSLRSDPRYPELLRRMNLEP